uniref:proto-oncogene c-Rel isoform X2 n=1 Tax=Doryrhamphus excisus TaxID=161450 RepID=UPI0025AE93EF|nr:proto-oncogene c-Rel isoform X2 [Doryrhamphus excisus]
MDDLLPSMLGVDPHMMAEPAIRIFEQPKRKGMRFRYECEGRSAGSILGEKSTDNNRTYPSLQILNYCGRGKVCVYLVTKNEPYRPHPHGLVGKDCKDGYYEAEFGPDRKVIAFQNLGIRCVKKKEVKDAIIERISRGINPFNVPREQLLQTDEYDLNVVRLCIQVFLQDETSHYTRALNPVVSNPIYDNRASKTAELKICRVNSNSGSVKGGDEIFLLCDKVQKDDIEVRFFSDGWEAKGSFSQADVHRQVAVVFKTPPFYNTSITETVTVQMQLRRPSDQEVSEPLDFRYLPDDKDPYGYNRKKRSRENLMKMTGLSVPFSGLAMSRQRAVPHNRTNMQKDNMYNMRQPSPSMQQQPTVFNQPYHANVPVNHSWTNPNAVIPMDTVSINPSNAMTKLSHPKNNQLQHQNRASGYSCESDGLPQLSMRDLQCLDAAGMSQPESHSLLYMHHQREERASDHPGQNHLGSQNQGLQSRWNNFQKTFDCSVPVGEGGALGIGSFPLLEGMEKNEFLKGQVRGGCQIGFPLKQEPQIPIGQESNVPVMTFPGENHGNTYTNLLPRCLGNGMNVSRQDAGGKTQPSETHFATVADWLRAETVNPCSQSSNYKE